MFPDLTRDDVFRIETNRLWLRWPCAGDAEAIVTLAGEPEVAGMTSRIPHPIDRYGTDAFIIEARRANSQGEAMVMAMSLRSAPAALAGLVSIEPDPEACAPHLGYWLGRSYWGRGLMSEATQTIVDAFFVYAGGQELTSHTAVENAASRRVLEKCGFVGNGYGRRLFPTRGEERPVNRFRLTRALWERMRKVGAAGLKVSGA